MESFPTQLGTLFGAVQAQIASVRAGLGFPALNGPDGAGTGTIPVGAEYEPYQLAAPSIVIVPVGEDFLPKRQTGTNPKGPDLSFVSVPTKAYFSSLLHFRAMLWGDPDPNFATTSDVLYDFDSTLELRREFIEALYTNAGGVPGFKLDGGRWDQPTNERRSGRMYVLSFSILSSIDSEPYIYLPFATATTSGVEMSTTFVLATDDTSNPASSEVFATLIAPPP